MANETYSETLVSLAMLKVRIDAGRDYLDYLRPFVIHVLTLDRPERVTDQDVRDRIREEFGLEVPAAAVQVILKRLATKRLLRKTSGVFTIASELPKSNIAARRESARAQIFDVASDLRRFSTTTPDPFSSDEDATFAICSFLSHFGVECLRAYLANHAIPKFKTKEKDAQTILVSQYVVHLRNDDDERFESFMVLVQGHMLANALLCPGLESAPKTYKNVRFFFDTPLLTKLLGLEGDDRRNAAAELARTIRALGGKTVLFSHTREELARVISASADYIESEHGRGAIVMEARRSGRTKSDLLLLAKGLDEVLETESLIVVSTPRYDRGHQIDEEIFDQSLQSEVMYGNDRAREYDINSVRSIYALRRGACPSSVEKSRAVLVTTNAAFSRAAYEFGRLHEESREVSTVITDFSLANISWLKAPMASPKLPQSEILAFSYAALQPSKGLLEKYMQEIDKLKSQGEIDPASHQLLRSSVFAQDELMRQTLGQEESLTRETISEVLSRIESDIKRDEAEKLSRERELREETEIRLQAGVRRGEDVRLGLYDRCVRRARLGSVMILGIAAAVVAVATVVTTLSLRTGIARWLVSLSGGVVVVFTVLNLVFGFKVVQLRRPLNRWILVWLLKREEADTGLSLRGLGNGEHTR